MKLTYTKDYQPPEEVVRQQLIAEGLPNPDTLEVSGSVIEMSFIEDITAEQETKIEAVINRLGYFLNV